MSHHSRTFDRDHTADLASFVQASPTPYHAVAVAADRLEKAGFQQVSETAAWDGRTGGRYVLRGGAILAWFVPESARPQTPYRVVGAHTDSPNLRVKPRPDMGAAGWRQVAVEVYGGPLVNSWLDRDLGLAGRLSLRDGSTRLVNVDRPLLRVAQLAIHLDRGVTDNGLTLDKQRHLQPLWGLGDATDGDLIDFMAAEAGVAAEDVAGWDLMTHDVQPPAFLGRDRELLASPRLDNLLSVHACLAALTAATEYDRDLSHIPVMVAFDHEENGSESDTGAKGPLLGRVLERSVHARGGGYEESVRALAGTVCVSSDVGHAVHPNYPERHDPTHHPRANGGPILKTNVNQRYATDGAGRAIFTGACERVGVPFQHFVSNNAMPCGTTIGPITAARHGITTVDIGVPVLSMHSARELCGADDPHMLASALRSFLEGEG
ncbi:M18 family aminopeptidase [Actinacidiphila sp. ITFR-21]|uniref:M18 family aminopeptidase n=1 Tax=Actinacidiphila sp. ITFR-21 TaxID=3075199 RepID=UPI00288BE70D|nr:M18 family aminopeptidase [Streptomyces sp. ITFR-21]WNI16744.1 M18 family aminopeptidase [Streptomyces sp. ITFR-21]